MKQWWASLNFREQLLLKIGGIVVIVLLFYSMIWSPLSTYINNGQTTLLNNQQLLQFIRSAETKLNSQQTTTHSETISDLNELITLINNSLIQGHLKNSLSQLTSPDDNSVKLSWEKVDFDHFIAWLQQFQQDYKIKVASLQIRAINNKGLVKGSVLIRFS